MPRSSTLLPAAFIAVGLTFAVPAALAQENSVPKDELARTLTSGAYVIQFAGGATLSFSNLPDGNLSSVLWRSSPSASRPMSGTGTGTWRIADDGKYCVKAGWRVAKNNNGIDACRMVIKAGDGEYLLKGEEGQPDWTMKRPN